VSVPGALRSVCQFRRLRRLHRTAGCGTACCAVQAAPLVLIVPLMVLAFATGSVGGLADGVGFVGISLMPVAAFLGFRLFVGARLRSMVRQAAEGVLDGALPVLLDALSVGDRCARAMAREGLLARLPTAHESATEPMGGDHWEAFHRLLRTMDDPLRMATLSLLERAGGARSLWHVEGLAGLGDQRSLFPQSGDTPVGREAARVLLAVRERATRERERATLLRPGGAPSDEADLLRPACGSSMAGDETLLRPSASGVSDEVLAAEAPSAQEEAAARVGEESA